MQAVKAYTSKRPGLPHYDFASTDRTNAFAVNLPIFLELEPLFPFVEVEAILSSFGDEVLSFKGGELLNFSFGMEG